MRNVRTARSFSVIRDFLLSCLLAKIPIVVLGQLILVSGLRGVSDPGSSHLLVLNTSFTSMR